jgi:ABC-type uncharacterized transport system permease subunit
MANAVRDNPERAQFLGYSSRWVRFYSFMASGFFCGIAGALFAINYEILTEENLNASSSGVILLKNLPLTRILESANCFRISYLTFFFQTLFFRFARNLY